MHCFHGIFTHRLHKNRNEIQVGTKTDKQILTKTLTVFAFPNASRSGLSLPIDSSSFRFEV